MEVDFLFSDKINIFLFKKFLVYQFVKLEKIIEYLRDK